MAFDVFGNNIKPGYCKAHPWICEEYPCCECTEEQQAARYPREMMAQMEEDYYAGQMRQLEMELKQGKE